MRITFWDIRVGDKIDSTGKAHNVYEIISKSEKTICLKRIKDGFQYSMNTEKVLKMINSFNGVFT